MTLDLESLKRAAEALVNDGTWQEGVSGNPPCKKDQIVSFGGDDIVSVAYVANKRKRDYIILAQPATILALIARLEASERDGARYRWLRDKSEPHKCALYMSVGEAFKDVKFTRQTVDTAIDDAIASEFPEGANAMAPKDKNE